jgi:NAD(P)-dependent dehydrogenase (short-subunit alcohol dehydrogenase family)
MKFRVPSPCRCDVADAAASKEAVEKIDAPKVLVHNAVGGAFGTFLDIDPAILQRNFDINTMARYCISLGLSRRP